uniref:Uncharacterized protein n=1 Tax=Calcidiscus leptoporus TaxID=127549 RepID=A0A7S0JES5_9EUKA|mmetsp:Transcript_53837/g.123882  ORF Transcript_53837/g.123882 Transcript_53837/m.123882 type:complete len:366 (+) Transcript_53837:1035-2132(+)
MPRPVAQVRLLLEYGAEVEREEGFATPLITASAKGHASCVRLLLEENAMLTATFESLTALEWAELGQHEACARLLETPLYKRRVASEAASAADASNGAKIDAAVPAADATTPGAGAALPGASNGTAAGMDSAAATTEQVVELSAAAPFDRAELPQAPEQQPPRATGKSLSSPTASASSPLSAPAAAPSAVAPMLAAKAHAPVAAALRQEQTVTASTDECEALQSTARRSGDVEGVAQLSPAASSTAVRAQAVGAACGVASRASSESALSTCRSRTGAEGRLAADRDARVDGAARRGGKAGGWAEDHDAHDDTQPLRDFTVVDAPQTRTGELLQMVGLTMGAILFSALVMLFVSSATPPAEENAEA